MKNKNSAPMQQKTFLAKRGFAMAVFSFAILLYIGSIGNGYNLDDELVTRNHRLTSKGVEAIPAIFSSFYYEDEMNYKYEYRPMVLTSFAIEHSLFGESPQVGHFISLLLYAITCVLLLGLLQELFKGYSPLLAFCVTLLFVAQPLHTEVVCSLKNRDEILALLFSLLSLRASLQFVAQKKWFALFWTVFFFILALLSKQSALIFLVLTPLVVAFVSTELKQALYITIVLIVPVLVINYFTGQIQSHFLWILPICLLPLVVVSHFLKWKSDRISKMELYKYINEWLVNDFQLVEFNINGATIFQSLLQVMGVVGVFLVFVSPSNQPLLLYLILGVVLITGIIKAEWVIALVLINGFYFYSTHSGGQPILFTLFAFIAIFLNESKSHSKWHYFILFVAIMASTILTSVTSSDDVVSLPIAFVFASIIAITILFHKVQKYRRVRFGFFILISCVTLGLAIINKSSTSFFVAVFLAFVALLHSSFGNKRLYIRIGLMIVYITSIIVYLSPIVSPSQILVSGNKNISQPLTPTTVQLSPDRELSFIEYPLGVHTIGSKKIGTTAAVMWHHFSKIIVPYPLSFYYGFNEVPIINAGEPIAVFSIILHLVLFCLALFLFKRHYLFSLGIFIYLTGSALYSNYFIPIPGMVADRFMYIPSLGWCIVLICGLAHLFKLNNIRDGNTQPTNKGFLVVVLTVLLCYSYMSYARSFDWKNHLTLMRKDLNHVPNSAQAHNLLALNIMKFSTETPMPPAEQFVMWQEATTHFKRSLEIYPKTFNVAFDLGRVYGMLNKTDSAIYYYKKAIFLDSTYIQLYLNMGELLFGKGDLRGAIPYYQKYMELTSNSYEGYGKLSFVYFQLKEFDQSIAINKQAILKLPFIPDPYINIGRVYISLQNNQEALNWLEKADSITQGRNGEIKTLIKTLR